MSQEAIESISCKIGRHFLELSRGEFDPDSFKRGLRLVTEYTRNGRERESVIQEPTIVEEYGGIEGFRVATYQLAVPKINAHKFIDALRGNKDDMFCIPIRVFDLPSNSKVHVYVTDPGIYIHTDDFIDSVSEGFFSFTGPTFKDVNVPYQDLPNNGFYQQGITELQPFRPISKGSRKGAFGIFEDGSLDILTDNEKFQIIDSHFANYHALIGCSGYLLSSDFSHDRELYDSGSSGKGNLSYLLQYWCNYETRRTAFVLAEGQVQIPTIARVIEDYAKRHSSQCYRSVATEILGASCVVITPEKGREKFGGRGFGGVDKRRDHYVVTL